MNLIYQCIIDLNEIDEKLSSFNCYFLFENTEIFTNENKLILKMQTEFDDKKAMDIMIDASAKNRPKLIAILDIISFLTGTTINVYDIKERLGLSGFNVTKTELFPQHKKTQFIYNSIDITKELDKIIDSFKKEKFLVASVLDKWNKANFLINSDDSSVLYVDEAILNYLHIFELLSETVKKDYDSQIENSLEYVMTEFYNQTSFYTNDIKSKINENKKAIKRLLVGEFPAFKDKLKYFLNKYQLLDENTSFFIDELIKLRNSIAHGRVIRNMNIIEYPLTPFFNISSTKRDAVNPLMFLTATCISKYIGINLWHNEWLYIKKNLQPANAQIKKYLNGEVTDILINSDDISNINWYSLFRFYIDSNSKYRGKVEQKVKLELLKIPFEELLLSEIFELSVVLSTTNDKEFFLILKNILQKSIGTHTYHWSNYKDIFSYLESRNYETKKIREIIKQIVEE